MSILIKGMKMPKNCDSCRFVVFEDTICGCPIVLRAHPQGEDHRPDYCPLVELPSHGRLIDADSLLKDGWCLYKQVMRKDGYAIHEMSLSCPSLPIVIEAEE